MPAAPMSYREIANDLADRIKAGEYNNSDKPLPTYAQLADLYTVSVSTAARAYGLLADRGITVGAPGRAVFIAEP